MVIGGKISPELVLAHPPFRAEVEEALRREEKKLPLSSLDRKRIELYDQARLFQAVAGGALPGFIPNPQDPRAGWVPLEALADSGQRRILENFYDPALLDRFQGSLRLLVEALRGDDRERVRTRALEFSSLLEQLMESRDIMLDRDKLSAELFYHQVRPFRWAWMLYLASGLMWIVGTGLKPASLASNFNFPPVFSFLGGFVMHTAGFTLRCLIAGRPPVSNMYESVIWVAWAAALFSILLGLIYRKPLFPQAAAWVASFSLLIGESFPVALDPSLSPLVPVLRSNYWLTLHVLTITLSYGAFALAWGIAHVNLWSFAFHPEREEEHERIHDSLYRVLQAGVALLAAGTILGGVWANASWGRFWGWDPKETWALIALLGYLTVLHGRFAGWLGAFGTALGSAVAFLGVLMAWYGVNFVLAAGLHSYGFGGGGVLYALAAVALDLVFISFLAFRYNKNSIDRALSHRSPRRKHGR